ncbi:hypothetical protein FBU59_005702, partial [Linderina macrospora]
LLQFVDQGKDGDERVAGQLARLGVGLYRVPVIELLHKLCPGRGSSDFGSAATGREYSEVVSRFEPQQRRCFRAWGWQVYVTYRSLGGIMPGTPSPEA